MADPTNIAQSAALCQMALDAPRGPIYKPLEPNKREVRLLEINDGLHCRLRHASLDKELEYCALSYYWGPSGVNKPITIDGATVQIRKTLYQFLRALYRQFGLFTVWLDVLCIHQQDVEEQSAEVAMVDDIYSQAQCVFSWLGKGDADTEYALSYLNCQRADTRGRCDPRMVLAGIEQIFLLRYCTRVWVVEECMLNRVVFVMCGSMMAELDTLFDAFHNLTTASTDGLFLENSIYGGLNLRQDNKLASERLKDIDTGRRSLWKGEKRPLLELAQTFSKLECQDSRDTFYGFRALATDGQSLPVDYGSGKFVIFPQVLSMHNWASFVDGLTGNELRQDLRGSNRIAHDHLEPPWWLASLSTNMLSTAKVLSSCFSTDSRSLLIDSHIICEQLRLPHAQILQGLADSSRDWLVLPVQPYQLPDHLQDALDFVTKHGVQDTAFGKFAALWDRPQKQNLVRYIICEESSGKDVWGSRNRIFVDVDKNTRKVVGTSFTADAVCNLVHWK